MLFLHENIVIQVENWRSGPLKMVYNILDVFIPSYCCKTQHKTGILRLKVQP